jgi:hypothetical protein
MKFLNELDIYTSRKLLTVKWNINIVNYIWKCVFLISQVFRFKITLKCALNKIKE